MRVACPVIFGPSETREDPALGPGPQKEPEPLRRSQHDSGRMLLFWPLWTLPEPVTAPESGDLRSGHTQAFPRGGYPREGGEHMRAFYGTRYYDGSSPRWRGTFLLLSSRAVLIGWSRCCLALVYQHHNACHSASDWGHRKVWCEISTASRRVRRRGSAAASEGATYERHGCAPCAAMAARSRAAPGYGLAFAGAIGGAMSWPS